MYYLQGHRVKNVGTHCKILPLEILMWKITSTSTYSSKVISKTRISQKIGKTSRSRSQGQNCWYHQKNLFTRNTRMKYIKALELSLRQNYITESPPAWPRSQGVDINN